MYLSPILFFFHLFIISKLDAKSIQLSLQSNFDHNSLLCQAAEFFSDIDPNLYWNFYNYVTSNCTLSVTDQDDFHCSLNYSLLNLNQPFTQLLNYALTLQYYAPKIEMFLKIGNKRINSIIDFGFPELFLDICDNHIILNIENIETYLRSTSLTCFSKIYSFDHSSDREIQAILYGSFGSLNTNAFLTVLKQLIINGSLRGFLFRPWYPVRKGFFEFHLSGYGVELAIKSTEYIVQDDIALKSDDVINNPKETNVEEFVNGLNFTLLISFFPSEVNNLISFHNHLNQVQKDIFSVKQWQWNDLGFQICQHVLNKHLKMDKSALLEIVGIIQNFPVDSKKIYHLSVSKELREEILHNQHIFVSIGLENGEGITLLNEKKMQNLDLFKNFEIFRGELFLMSSIHGTGVVPSDILKFLRVKLVSKEVDYILDIRDESVLYINDIENGEEYSLWTSNVQELLRPTFPGIIRQIRRNFFNLVFFLDPSEETTYILLMVANAFLSNSLALRIGFVMKPRNYDNVDTYRTAQLLHSCFNFIYKNSKKKAFLWLLDFHKDVNFRKINPNIDIANEICYSSTGFNASTFINQYGNFEDSYNFYQASGLHKFPTILLNGFQVSTELFQQKLSPNKLIEKFIYVINDAINLQTRILQADVYFGKLLNQMDVNTFLMTKPNVIKRYNSRILSQEFSILNLFCFDNSRLSFFNSIDLLSDCQSINIFSENTPYIINPDYDSTLKPISIWLVADFSTKLGFHLLNESLYFLSHSNISRIALIFNLHTTSGIDLNRIFEALIFSQSESFLFPIFSELIKISDVSDLTLDFVLNTLSNFSWFKIDKFTSLLNHAILHSNYIYLSSHVLKLNVSSRCLIVNGRILGPFLNDEKFLHADFGLLEEFFYRNNGQELFNMVNSYSFSQENDVFDNHASLIHFKSNAFLKIYSSLSKNNLRNNEIKIPREKLLSNYSKFDLKPQIIDEIYFSLDVIIDPLTKDAQKLLPIVFELYNIFNIHLQLWLFPRQRISEFPLNRFYRYVLNSGPIFSKNGSLSKFHPYVKFADLPNSLLLTLALDVPHVWMVEVVSSHHDLDNLHMEDVTENIVATFKLAHILIEGQCLDYLNHNSLPGLQLTLETELTSHSFDSLVMANLGYFQFKSLPGIWKLNLIEAPHMKIMKQHGGEEIQSDSSLLICLTDFNGKFLDLYISEMGSSFFNDGQINIIEDKKDDNTFENFWDSLSNYLPKFEIKENFQKNVSKKVINIFSIASGHLYERFLRIMMLSVLKNTNNPVKFWLLKNYFSPQFKKFIPVYAELYNFTYELVEYKWPKWLRAQELKQREIWGYKILFLDVLFSLKINRIIYIDADQVVRANVLELFEFDLNGAPYGYVPFCDSRKEMNGFRFWKQGYWENLLRHRKYHISALYVVDLVRFREIGAGDRLRENYQALSHDPNSLANLDQDLPNSMIHSVPIFSLPQDWLWCETWCSEEEKSIAKTIDICNNPLTKEPKLKAAKRIINEWVDYDDEINQLFLQVAYSNLTSKDQSYVKKDSDYRHLEL